VTIRMVSLFPFQRPLLPANPTPGGGALAAPRWAWPAGDNSGFQARMFAMYKPTFLAIRTHSPARALVPVPAFSFHRGICVVTVFPCSNVSDVCRRPTGLPCSAPRDGPGRGSDRPVIVFVPEKKYTYDVAVELIGHLPGPPPPPPPAPHPLRVVEVGGQLPLLQYHPLFGETCLRHDGVVQDTGWLPEGRVCTPSTFRALSVGCSTPPPPSPAAAPRPTAHDDPQMFLKVPLAEIQPRARGGAVGDCAHPHRLSQTTQPFEASFSAIPPTISVIIDPSCCSLNPALTLSRCSVFLATGKNFLAMLTRLLSSLSPFDTPSGSV